MHSSSHALRLLEGACRVIVALGAVCAALLLLTVNPEALLIAYKRGGLSPLIVLFAGACVGWLCLRLIRSQQRPPVVLVIGAVCAVGLLSVLWQTTHSTAEEQRFPPPPPTAGP
ncbi:hypothetical protein ACFUTV_42660 [Streptomyces sp. NPDC057298]|uniref:hypothetical protein n=1 Tax=Streptomyces sp. NPDC057298 TaxID=3346091 RepID=UPI003635EF33